VVVWVGLSQRKWTHGQLWVTPFELVIVHFLSEHYVAL